MHNKTDKNISSKSFPKDRFINNIPDATEEDKKRYKLFFQKYRQAESQIDWNDKHILSKSYFEQLISNYIQSKNIYYQFQNSDFFIIGENSQYLFVQVLTYNGARYVNSFQCGGQGAKWCTGDSNSIQKWIEPVEDNRILVLAYNKVESVLENERKYMLEYIPYEKKIIAHHQTNDPFLRIFDKKVYDKFLPPFNFETYSFIDTKKYVNDFYADVLLNFIDGYEDFFDNHGIYNNEKNIKIILASPIKTYNNLTVNDTIFDLIKCFSDEKTENPLIIQISSNIYEPVIFKTDFGSFSCDIQLFNDYVIPNILAYANYGKKVSELLQLSGCLRSKNFINFLKNYNHLKVKQKELVSKYDFEYQIINEIILQISNKKGNDIYEISDFSYIENFNVNEIFHLFRFRRDTNRFSLDYGAFYQNFEVSLTEENYNNLAKFFNYLRGLSESEVERIFQVIKIDSLGNIVMEDEVVKDVSELVDKLNLNRKIN